MIFGGTALQTIILGIMTVRCDWEKEVTHFKCYHFIHTKSYKIYIWFKAVKLIWLSFIFLYAGSKGGLKVFKSKVTNFNHGLRHLQFFSF